ncbi:MAG: aspartate aminotransferase family protein [Gammaproteobacteria bacterium]
MSSPLMNVYHRLPVAFTHGEGVWLYDTEGKRYLDALAGIAVNVLGHAHPAIVEAVCDQASKLMHTSNVYEIPLQTELAQKLVDLSGLDQAFICSTGAEAAECMVKLARMYAHKREIRDPGIIVMEKAFHGRSMATLSASGSRRVQAGFEPLVQGFIRAPFNDLETIRSIAKHNHHHVVAVMLEPIQGEGGLHVPSPEYLQGLRQICDENEWLLMLDEVQSGIGHTGKMFAYEYAGIKPDVLALAKGLGGGIPIGACLAGGRATDLFEPGNHGSTFGGNPLSCRVALTVLDTLIKNKIIERVPEVSDYFFKRLREALAGNPHVKDIRGQGLLIGIEMDAPARPLLYKGLEEGILFSVTAETVVRLAPALIFTKEDVDYFVERFARILSMS